MRCEQTATVTDTEHRTYRRQIDPGVRTSLSVLARYVQPGAVVLDVGTGDGAMGRYLQSAKGCVVDGVTHSAGELESARASYRQIVLADLDGPDWHKGLRDGGYGVIVCADVLEHLRHPEELVRRCADLLAPDGCLLVSVPNASYAGFVAELMHGRLRLGDEGLLDRTHLRLFTRSSCVRMLQECGWRVDSSTTIDLPWFETEFHQPLDKLPPAVARHLLAQPDSAAYQLLFVARPPQATDRPGDLAPADPGWVASYVSQLFIAGPEGFQHERRVDTLARVGQHGQTLRFTLPDDLLDRRAVRLDLADRPGFFRLHAITVLDHLQQPVWSWKPGASEDGPRTWNRHQVEVGTAPDGAPWQPLLLTGDDPQLHVPVPPLALRDAHVVEVVCDWPLSADYEAAIRDARISPRQHVPAEPPRPAGRHGTDEPRGLSRWTRRLFSAARPSALPADRRARQAQDTCVEIIVPVYGNHQLVQRCVESVLASRCATAWHLTVLNDASPEPALGRWLRALASSHPEITVLENGRNLGFVQTVNIGMRLAGRRDVVLLNSDTEVAGDWLDRLRRAAWAAPRVGSVTPFSNNATICSLPRFCEDNPLPAGQSVASLHATCAAVNAGRTVEIPTAVGFCMYIRRDCLDQVGEFDAERFGVGYGEENDWCMRAAALGWTHLHALDAFVWHAGGASFSDRRAALQKQAAKVLLSLHPDYDRVVRAFVQADPARPYREAVLRTLEPPASDAAAPAQGQ